MKQQASFGSLPQELKEHILSFVGEPVPSLSRLHTVSTLEFTDSEDTPLKCISLVSRQFRQLATPLLFKHARIKIPTWYSSEQALLSSHGPSPRWRPEPNTENSVGHWLHRYSEKINDLIVSGLSHHVETLCLIVETTSRFIDLLQTVKPNSRLEDLWPKVSNFPKLRRYTVVAPPPFLTILLSVEHKREGMRSVAQIDHLHLVSVSLAKGVQDCHTEEEASWDRFCTAYQWDDVVINQGVTLLSEHRNPFPVTIEGLKERMYTMTENNEPLESLEPLLPYDSRLWPDYGNWSVLRRTRRVTYVAVCPLPGSVKIILAPVGIYCEEFNFKFFPGEYEQEPRLWEDEAFVASSDIYIAKLWSSLCDTLNAILLKAGSNMQRIEALDVFRPSLLSAFSQSIESYRRVHGLGDWKLDIDQCSLTRPASSAKRNALAYGLNVWLQRTYGTAFDKKIPDIPFL